MDAVKIGALLYALRKEKNMTQLEVALALNISDKTVSKWERGAGCPDISALPSISALFGTSIDCLLSGNLDSNEIAGGNMKKNKYFVCEECGNITLSTGDVQVSCCGRTLDAHTPQKPDKAHELSIEKVEDEWYIETAHPMKKEHFISFIAFASTERLELIKQYPEWDLSLRLRGRHGLLLWYCTDHKLFYKNI